MRGAPAIAIVGCLSLAVEIVNNATFSSKADFLEFLQTKLDYLVTSRPTAVNMQKSATEIVALASNLLADGNIDVATMTGQLIEFIESMLVKDVADNVAIGQYGAADILAKTGKTRVKVLTHCNTGENIYFKKILIYNIIF